MGSCHGRGPSVTLDLSNGIEQPRVQIAPAAGGITEAAPVWGGR